VSILNLLAHKFARGDVLAAVEPYPDRHSLARKLGLTVEVADRLLVMAL
jgi:hypothetical protein